MKRVQNYLTPAEAGYYTNTLWESAFKTAFDTLRGDARSRELSTQPAPAVSAANRKAGRQVRLFGTDFGFSSAQTSQSINKPHRTTQEGTHGKVR
jgi:hypothetical protein